MATTYTTTVIGSGNHASIEIPDTNLHEINGTRRAPLKITINNHTYQSTATGVDGKCMVVFPQRERDAAHVQAGDTITVTLELDSGYRNVDLSPELVTALNKSGLQETFAALTYSPRREHARSVADAKTDATRDRRIDTIINSLRNAS